MESGMNGVTTKTTTPCLDDKALLARATGAVETLSKLDGAALGGDFQKQLTALAAACDAARRLLAA